MFLDDPTGRPALPTAGGGALARMAPPLLVAGALTAATGYVAAVDPGVSGHYPGCPLLAVTGWYCPGCGSLRAVHALTHGHLGAALHDNALTTLALPFALWAWWAWAGRRAADRPIRRLAPPWVMWALLALTLGFWVLRNLPGFGWLAP